MRTRYIQIEPGRRENLGAAAVSVALAAGVGITAFYLTRLFLSRETIGREAEGEARDVLGGKD